MQLKFWARKSPPHENFKKFASMIFWGEHWHQYSHGSFTYRTTSLVCKVQNLTVNQCSCNTIFSIWILKIKWILVPLTYSMCRQIVNAKTNKSRHSSQLNSNHYRDSMMNFKMQTTLYGNRLFVKYMNGCDFQLTLKHIIY